MELVDMLDLGSSASRRGSSSLPARTGKKLLIIEELFLWNNVTHYLGRREASPERGTGRRVYAERSHGLALKIDDISLNFYPAKSLRIYSFIAWEFGILALPE
jgi:hypothetical protein